MVFREMRREMAAFGMAGAAASLWVAHRIGTTAPQAEPRLGVPEGLAVLGCGLIVWLAYPWLRALRRPQGLVRPRAGAPGRGGLPGIDAMRAAVIGHLATSTCACATEGASRTPGQIVSAALAKRLGEYPAPAPLTEARIRALEPGQVFELWALSDALLAEGPAAHTALARIRPPRWLAPLRQEMAKARSRRAKSGASDPPPPAPPPSPVRGTRVELGPDGLTGFLGRRARTDPALWHQILCGLEPGTEREAVTWILRQPETNPGGLAHWLGRAADLGTLNGTITGALGDGDVAFLAAISDAIERWNMESLEPVWAPAGADPLSDDIERLYRAEMARLTKRLGYCPLPLPDGLFEAATVPAPEPVTPYRYSSAHGLVEAPYRAPAPAA